MEGGARPPRDLPDEAIIVRGGESEVSDMRVSCDTHYGMRGTHALSGCSVVGATPEEIAIETGARFLPHNRMRCATAGRLREAGFPVSFDRKKGTHVAIEMPDFPTDDDYKALRDLFDPSIENPVSDG